MPKITIDIPISIHAVLPVDLVKYFAEAFGATGRMIRSPEEITPVMKEALDHTGPIIVGVHVDYSDNHKLFEMVRGDSIH